jgi:O-antigen ligase
LNEDIGIRSNIYKSSFNLLKHNYIIGVGTGDVQESLNYQYRYDNFNLGLKKSLNSHNQYLEETLRNGIIGLLSFLFMILFPLYIALKNKNSFFITLFFFFLVFMLSECILNRQQGVSFVSLFLSLFILRLKKDNK